jgi:hypothetical protein
MATEVQKKNRHPFGTPPSADKGQGDVYELTDKSKVCLCCAGLLMVAPSAVGLVAERRSSCAKTSSLWTHA